MRKRAVLCGPQRSVSDFAHTFGLFFTNVPWSCFSGMTGLCLCVCQCICVYYIYRGELIGPRGVLKKRYRLIIVSANVICCCQPGKTSWILGPGGTLPDDSHVASVTYSLMNKFLNMLEPMILFYSGS